MEKKTWQKPELISLERTKPQESVLTTCKYGDAPGDPGTSCSGCRQPSGLGCNECDLLNIS